ncbi:MAG: formylglycine-generating enzyme family protein, partial [Methylococcales bacterium]
ADEAPQHEVTIAQPFAIGKFEVTFAEYDRFAQATGRPLPDDSGWGRDRQPVINVSWIDAQAYARWLSQQTGINYRLPSEAEWEYAARAGSTTPYFWDDKGRIEDYAWYYKNSGDRTHPVGEKKPNAFGLYDTVGNVWEWTLDCWHDSYQNAPADGSAWLESDKGDCVRRVLRGGSWVNGPQFVRSAVRNGFNTDVAYFILGFRVARAL